MSHCRASSFYNHLDHCFVVLKHIQKSFHMSLVNNTSFKIVGPGLQCRLTSPRRLYTKLHLSRELEVKTGESCLLGISARNEGQNGPSADKNQEFGVHSITFAPHRPQQRENQTNSGGSIEKCGAIGIGNGKTKKVFTTKPKAEHKHSKPSHVACGGQLRFARETVTHTHTTWFSRLHLRVKKKNKTVDTTKRNHRQDRMFWS